MDKITGCHRQFLKIRLIFLFILFFLSYSFPAISQKTVSTSVFLSCSYFRDLAKHDYVKSWSCTGKYEVGVFSRVTDNYFLGAELDYFKEDIIYKTEYIGFTEYPARNSITGTSFHLNNIYKINLSKKFRIEPLLSSGIYYLAGKGGTGSSYPVSKKCFGFSIGQRVMCPIANGLSIGFHVKYEHIFIANLVQGYSFNIAYSKDHKLLTFGVFLQWDEKTDGFSPPDEWY